DVVALFAVPVMTPYGLGYCDDRADVHRRGLSCPCVRSVAHVSPGCSGDGGVQVGLLVLASPDEALVADRDVEDAERGADLGLGGRFDVEPRGGGLVDEAGRRSQLVDDDAARLPAL